MSRSLLIGGVVLGCMAVLSMVAALGTSNWMTACFPIASLLKSMSSAQPNNAQIQNALNQPGMEAVQSSNMCFNVGLFRISMTMDKLGYGASFALSLNSWDIFIEATAGLLVSGVILMIIAVVLLLVGICSRSMNAQRKVSAKAYTRIGAAVLIVGTILYGVGITVYTAEQAKTVHNPQMFLIQIGSAMQKSFSSAFNNMGGSQSYPQFSNSANGNSPGRKRRQSDSWSTENDNMRPFPLDFTMPPLPMDGNNIPSNVDIGNTGPDSGYKMPPYPVNSNFDPKLGGKGMEQMATFLKLIDPVFGYSFYLAWIGFIFALFAAIMCAFTCRRMNAYADDMQPVL